MANRMHFLRMAAILAVAASTIALVAACGADADSGIGGSRDQKISAADQIFTIDDLRSVGYKTSKQYDVAELPGAIAAWYGFFKSDLKNPRDYEVRFYSSHKDAVALGIDPADEASGADAKLDEDTASWTVGLKDRKRLSSGGTADLAAWSGSLQTKYGDFVVVGNMALLCEGTNSAEALERCEPLVDLLTSDQGQ